MPKFADQPAGSVKADGRIPSAAIRKTAVPLLNKLLFFVTFMSCVLYNSQILKFFGGNIFEALNRSLYIIAGATFLFGILVGEITAGVLCLPVFLYLSAMSVVGSEMTLDGYQNSLLLSYVALSLVPVLAFLIRTGRSVFISKYCKYSLIIYFLLYVYFSLTLSVGDFKKSGGGFIMASGDRDARILVDATAASLGIFIGLSNLKSKNFSISNIVLTVLAISSLYFSATRVLSLILAVVSVNYLFFGMRKFISTIYISIFLLCSAYLLGSFSFGINIYSLFSGDSSGYARMQEFKSIQDAASGSTLMIGNGFFNPVASDLYEKVDYTRMVFWNDMGLYGIIYATGIVGLIMFLYLSCASIKSNGPLIRSGIDRITSDAFSLALISIALYGILAPGLWTSGLPLVSVLIAARSLNFRKRR